MRFWPTNKKTKERDPNYVGTGPRKAPPPMRPLLKAAGKPAEDTADSSDVSEEKSNEVA